MLVMLKITGAIRLDFWTCNSEAPGVINNIDMILILPAMSITCTRALVRLRLGAVENSMAGIVTRRAGSIVGG